jgi:hypothetical protein
MNNLPKTTHPRGDLVLSRVRAAFAALYGNKRVLAEPFSEGKDLVAIDYFDQHMEDNQFIRRVWMLEHPITGNRGEEFQMNLILMPVGVIKRNSVHPSAWLVFNNDEFDKAAEAAMAFILTGVLPKVRKPELAA